MNRNNHSRVPALGWSFAAALVVGLMLAALLPIPAHAATPIYVRPDGDDTNCNGTTNDPYPGGGPGLNCAVKTIQKGIDLVDAGGTVNVAAGTYSVATPISIPCNKVPLNLIGAGRDVTVVQKASGDTGNPVLLIGNQNPCATTGGTLVEGFTFQNSGATLPNNAGNSAYRGIRINHSGTSGAWGRIRNNRFLNFVDTGIAIPDYQLQYWEITGNIFSESRLAIWTNDSRHIKIKQNVIEKMVVGVGVDACDISFDVEVTDNQLDSGTSDGSSPSLYWAKPSNYYGVYMGGAARDWTISNNDITRATWGIYVLNCASGNDLSGVEIDYNSIHGNTVLGNAASTPYGVTNMTTLVLNAECNWWGLASGPTHASNPGGTGDAVSDLVDYVPWMYDGTDTNPGTPGFQPSPANVCGVPPPPPTPVPTLSEWGMLILTGLLAGYGAWTLRRRKLAA